MATHEPHLVFLKRLPVALAIALALWWIGLRPLQDRAVPFLAQALVRAFEVPKVTRLVPDDHRVQVRRSDFRSDSKIPTIALTEIHFNTIVLLALYLALPRPPHPPQLERLVMGWTVLVL